MFPALIWSENYWGSVGPVGINPVYTKPTYPDTVASSLHAEALLVAKLPTWTPTACKILAVWFLFGGCGTVSFHIFLGSR